MVDLSTFLSLLEVLFLFSGTELIFEDIRQRLLASPDRVESSNEGSRSAVESIDIRPSGSAADSIVYSCIDSGVETPVEQVLTISEDTNCVFDDPSFIVSFSAVINCTSLNILFNFYSMNRFHLYVTQ